MRRYYVNDVNGHMVETQRGPWVRYVDAQALADALRSIEEACNYSPHRDAGTWDENLAKVIHHHARLLPADGVKVPAPTGHIMSPPSEEDADLIGGGEHLNPEKFISKADIERANGVQACPDLAYLRACEKQNLDLLEAIGYPHEKDTMTSPEEYAAELKRKADAFDALGVPASEPTQREKDLALLVKRLCRRLQPDDMLREAATDYLRREGLLGTPLRSPDAGVSASIPHPLPAQANDGGEHG